MNTSWLAEHLEAFVKPVLGFIPKASVPFFSAEEMTVLKNCWRSAKASAAGKKILLPGRDVFIFEVLARRENYPTLFMPECSRATAAALRTFGRFQMEEKEELFLLDTGFVGTIPVRLGIDSFGLLSYSDRSNNVGRQVFPRLTLSRGLALKVEKTPKYWESGRIVDGKVCQWFSGKEEFEKAAQLTIEVYKNSVPRFVQKAKPIGGKLCSQL